MGPYDARREVFNHTANTSACSSRGDVISYSAPGDRQYTCIVAELQFCRLFDVSVKYVEIKCHLDATEVFIAYLIARSTCFGHHYAHHQELKSIIQWLLPVVFGAVVPPSPRLRSEAEKRNLNQTRLSPKSPSPGIRISPPGPDPKQTSGIWIKRPPP